MAAKQVKCSVCGQAIKTASGSMLAQTQTLVCRRCFGEQSYGGRNAKSYSTIAPSVAGGAE